MKTILATRNDGETRIFVLNEDVEEAYYSVRDDDPPRLAGSIFKGRVQNIMTGMQAAFVDIGRGKNVFLQYDKKIKLRVGDSVLVQVEKDAEKLKNARATLNISLPSRKLILLPTVGYIGLSQKIPPKEKDRLHNIIKKVRQKNIGVIVRTAAINSSEEELTEAFEEQMNFWKSVIELSKKKKTPSLIWGDGDLLTRIVREELSDDVAFLTDSLKIYRQVSELVKKNLPDFTDKIYYLEDEDIFEKFGVNKEIDSLNEKELPLPSGGFIVIENTEALTAVDVNTGSFAGTDNLSDTIYQTNLEAAELILKQLRLRNIGGIIIVDFIDMQRDSQRDGLMLYLRELAQMDRSNTKIVDMTPLGLVEITRRKSYQA